MNINTLFHSLLAMLLLVFVSSSSSFKAKSTSSNLLKKDPVILCSGKILEYGKCTGSVYCTACTSCEYCAHCNSGGSCGVCGKREPKRKSYYTPSKKKSNSPIRSSSNTPSFQLQTNETTTLTHSAQYVVILETSLRELPASSSKVILRFKTGDKVIVLNDSDEWWCKVNYNNNIGWVKKRLLKKY